MFDISFTELLVIAVVALVVIGPERLPKVARTAGHLLGRLQRYVSDVKSDIQREMQLEELKKLQAEVAESARQMEEKLTTDLRDAEQQLKSGFADVQQAGSDVAGALTETAASVNEAGREIAAAGSAETLASSASPALAAPAEDESIAPVPAPADENKILADGGSPAGHSGLGAPLPSPSTPTETPVAKG
ncbi:Sec-independent protein translocase protein TatB [Oryzomicrobium sp.]|uniref:Sec-independent protein translocase protein TatB n=1 Tax=Oryzomicrobium sp. TaxID=1911578 RepID=UPI002FE14E6A